MTEKCLREYREIIRQDFYAFIELAFAELNPQTKFLRNWHIEVLAATLERVRAGEIRRLIINVPPRSRKSLGASIAFPARLLGHDPAAQILAVSYAPDLADGLGLHAVTRYEPWGDKHMRLYAQTATIENGFVHLPKEAPWLAEYLHELTTFPSCKYDDQADSIAQALSWLNARPVQTALYARPVIVSRPREIPFSSWSDPFP